MSFGRIGDKDLAASERGESSAGALGQRLGAAIASPLGVLLIVPGLVAAVGLFLTLLGQRALRDSTTQLGSDRFAEQTSFVCSSIAASLAQADPMLERMRELALTHSPDDPAGPLAHSLRGLMQGRPGVAYVSMSFPDGTFRGAYLEDGVIRFKEARVTPQRTRMDHFDFVGVDGIELRGTTINDYDPRTRGFYRRALEAKGRVWTKPYTFYESKQTGVTRAEPVFEPGSPDVLRAVLTADFDIHALSDSMPNTWASGTRTILYAGDGTLLAYPEGASAIAKVPLRQDRPLSYRDLGDPVMDAFFKQVERQVSPIGTFSEFMGGNDSMLAMVAPVPGFPELQWNVAAIVPESAFFRPRRVHERQSLSFAAVSLLLALGIAIAFAQHVVRVRREVAVARDIAREATERARELGSYRLVERLGAGGMGEVWRAQHRLLAKEAAIKLIRPEALASANRSPAELRERFRREAQTLATLQSRNTIQIFDYGVTEDGTFFYVMELLDGMDLQTLVERHGPQPAGRVIQLLLQVCSSLAEAHDAGLVHRDIKPANVYVCRAADEVDVVKVLDFGLVQGMNRASLPPDAPGANEISITQEGQLMGTPAFMAPEQVLGRDVDARADIYSLGCVAWWLLTGQMPFGGESPLAVMIAHAYQGLPELSALVDEPLPFALKAILRQCLAKRPEDRPSNVRELANCLRVVPIPPEHEWTSESSRAWWTERASPPVTDEPLRMPNPGTPPART